jgi:hypothetical protein
LHANVTEHPTAIWFIQQLREAFAWETTGKYLLGVGRGHDCQLTGFAEGRDIVATLLGDHGSPRA